MAPEVFLLKLRCPAAVLAQSIRRAVQERVVTGRVEMLKLS
jgi:hypothetical protein